MKHVWHEHRAHAFRDGKHVARPATCNIFHFICYENYEVEFFAALQMY